jgi:transcriptional regulator with XRE-family HTH domain
MNSNALLRSLGELIRSNRIAQGLTQRALGDRAGIGGRYVSEIERGTREDLPLSTLQAIVERGLELHLEIGFHVKGVARELPAHVAQVAAKIAELPAETSASVLLLVRGIVELADVRRQQAKRGEPS